MGYVYKTKPSIDSHPSMQRRLSYLCDCPQSEYVSWYLHKVASDDRSKTCAFYSAANSEVNAFQTQNWNWECGARDDIRDNILSLPAYEYLLYTYGLYKGGIRYEVMYLLNQIKLLVEGIDNESSLASE